MTPRWRSEVGPGWTGSWELPAALRAPPCEEERWAVVALSMSGVGPGAIVAALGEHGSAAAALAASAHGADVREAQRRVARADARAVLPGDQEYPPLLAAIPAAPPVLFVRGAELTRLQPAVAIVGARVCTPGGARFAETLGRECACVGMTVVAGLARGIDSAAHHGALESGTTIAVLGTGINLVYPSEHRALASRIAERGSLVTEFPPGVAPRAWHFPARNRIISGLSLAVIVVEAGHKSGALITAGFALDHGREVLACTVSPTSPSGAGVREMLRDGAPLIVDGADAVERLTALAADRGWALRMPAPTQRVIRELQGDAALVFEAVLEQSSADEIARSTGLAPGRVAAALAALELEDAVRDEGGLWSRAP